MLAKAAGRSTEIYHELWLRTCKSWTGGCGWGITTLRL